MKLLTSLACVALSLVAASPASAATYIFDIAYNGSASLALGSDNPLTTTLNVGDSFTYKLTATGGYFQDPSAYNYFAALRVGPSSGGTRQIDYTYSLLNAGTSVQSGFSNNLATCCIHVGKSINIGAGLIFDQLTFGATILPGSVVSTPLSILPYSGVPHGFTEVAAVPEPSTWAMMLLGFTVVGFAMRRRRVTALAAA